MTEKKRHNACIISDVPMPDLAEILNAAEPIQLTRPFASLHEFLQSESAKATDIAFLNVEELLKEPMDFLVKIAPCCGSYMVAVGDTIDPQRIKVAMRAGARDYLVRPLNPKDLYEILQHAVDYMDVVISTHGALHGEPHVCETRVGAPAPKRGRIFTFFSPKDGSGKTTLLANFGMALAASTGKTVCFVDFVPQFGDLSPMFDLRPRATIGNIIATPAEQIADDIQSFLTPVGKNVFLLAASPRPEEGELLRPKHIAAVLHALQPRFDYIVVDTPCAFSDVALAALDASSSVFLVLTPNVLSIRSLKSSIEVLEGSLKYKPEKLKVVLNQSDDGSTISHKNIESILGHPIRHRIPSDSRAMATAANHGKLAIVENPKSKFARAVTDMALVESGAGRSNGAHPKTFLEGLGLFTRREPANAKPTAKGEVR